MFRACGATAVIRRVSSMLAAQIFCWLEKWRWTSAPARSSPRATRIERPSRKAPPPTHRVEHLVPNRVVGHVQERDRRIARVDEGKDDGEDRQTAGEVRRPVEGVDQPESTRRAGSASLFFAVEPVAGKALLERGP